MTLPNAVEPLLTRIEFQRTLQYRIKREIPRALPYRRASLKNALNDSRVREAQLQREVIDHLLAVKARA